MNAYPVNHIRVGLQLESDVITVGRLLLHDKTIYFEYDASFIHKGLNISPLKCPLTPGLKTFEKHLFDGLPGVFNDSLPDGWGRLLFDRHARAKGIIPEGITPLDRLTQVGRHGIGALVYEPDYTDGHNFDIVDLDAIAGDVEQVLLGEAVDVLQELIRLNGSSAGARPKAMIGVDHNKQKIVYGTQKLENEFAYWIVKFPNMNDGNDAGLIEYVYALMAKDAGINMEEIHLFHTQRLAHYFATKRFDRDQSKRLHVHTVCGLLHTDFRTPNLDYENLLALTMGLTKDIKEVEKMYRLAVFNVLSHNRDDHAKNFSFLMNELGQWTLSPAYDLTFSSGPGGEQSMTVTGEGRNPNISHLRALGGKAGFNHVMIDNIIERTKYALSQWESLSKEYGVLKDNINFIASKLKEIMNNKA
jgi:serine/threonine-protein kinase HipA